MAFSDSELNLISIRKKNYENFRAARRKRAGILSSPPEIAGLLGSDNLVPKKFIDSGAEVVIPRYLRPLKDDHIIVYLREQIVHEVTIADPATELPYRFLLDGAQLGASNGAAELKYVVQYSSGTEFKSSPLALNIDMRPPNGGNSPQAMIFPPEVVSGGITLEYLAANGGNVIAKITDPAALHAGMTVVPGYGSSTANTPFAEIPVDQAAVDQGYIEVPISEAVVKAAGEGRVSWSYVLFSRAGYQGGIAVPVSLATALRPVPAGLKDPVIPMFDVDSIIDLPDADAGVEIQVDSYSNVLSGDLLIAKWGNLTLTPVTIVSGAFPVRVPVPRSVVIQVGTGNVEVSYQIYRNPLSYDSGKVSVTVDVDTIGPVDPTPETPENENLGKASISGGSGTSADNVLRPDDKGKSATVTVPFYDGAKENDVISIYVEKRDVPVITRSVTADEVAAKALDDFTLTADMVDAIPNGTNISLWYTLSANKTPSNPVLAPTQSIDVLLAGPGGPDGLLPPTILGANSQGFFDYDTVKGGITVKIAPYINIQKGDEVTLSWLSYSTYTLDPGSELPESAWDSAAITVGDPELALGLEFLVPFDPCVSAMLGANPEFWGGGKATYVVKQSGIDFSSEEATAKFDLIGSAG